MNSAAQHIGTTPAGVVWNVYPKTGETPEAFEARVEKMRARFEVVTARQVAERAEVKRITKTAFANICAVETAEMVDRLDWKGGKLIGTREDLRHVADTCADFDEFTLEGTVDMDATEEQVAFGMRQKARSLKTAGRRIRHALGID